ncbi:FG-GAP and VCBS repeat-containing protein [Streptomyces sp. NRRL B-1347]|uniref:FG-GAP and VCBS repeat-containing protein n=1 Tax=Streptomyces sp. NRRL B-1347 TaxID=1476877 RepID=UPI0004C47F46|nr:FG-GAP and VCBS repeat-containing protein [Streptomyces sp. NRRL B-1347]
MRRTLIAAVAAVAVAVAAPLPLAASGTASAAAPNAAKSAAKNAGKAPVTDFNKDGYADLVLAAPRSDVDGKQEAGYAAVVYGSKNGPDRAHPRLVDRSVAGGPGEVTDYGNFGDELATGDFDADGYTDLLIGTNPFVTVALWGSADGLSRAATTFKTPVGPGTGDLNGDGRVDLVSKVYPSGEGGEGGILAAYGPFTRDGEPAKRTSIAIPNSDQTDDIIVGDVTGDGIDDVITNHSYEEDAYGSRFWPGSKNGLAQRHTRTLKSSEGGTVADVDGDGYGDFVTRDNGSSNDDNYYEAGTVRVDYGSKNGPAATRTAKITQNTPGVPGVSEKGGYVDGEYHSGDQFGAALSAADVNGDGYADIAVGVPGEDVQAGGKNVLDAGGVVLLKGGRPGLTGAGAKAFTQSTPKVPGASERDDQFGRRVKLADVNGDKKPDLAVTAPFEDGAAVDSGAAWVFRGATGGLSTSGIASFGPAALGAPEKGAELGRRLGR